jgi:transposase-like protein
MAPFIPTQIFPLPRRKRCPNVGCRFRRPATTRFFIKKGYFKTKWNGGQLVPRYRCKGCGRYFSSHTERATFGQHRPDLNEQVLHLYASAMTQRRMAICLATNRKTVVRKFLFAAKLARNAHRRRLAAGTLRMSRAQFDEMETFEHTRLKPLSIALAVHATTSELIEARVATMPYRGSLASIARRKYGPRPDTRAAARHAVLRAVRRCSLPALALVTDKHPHYPPLIARLLPFATHIPVSRTAPLPPDRRNPNDPLFTLNHTAAKIRHDLSRMARRVWVTTKRKERLQAHLDLYIAWNNRYRLLV